jgi:intracellular multiplication protein IcmE
MSEKFNNIGNIMSNPKQRNSFLMVGGIIVLSIGVGLFVATRNNQVKVASNADLGTVPTVKAGTGISNNPLYVQSVQDDNNKKATEALKNGTTALPVITAPINQTSQIDDFKRKQAEEDALKAEEARKKAEEEEKRRLEEEARKQRELLAAQQRNLENNFSTVSNNQESFPIQKQKVSEKKYSDEDAVLISTLLQSWGNKAPHSEFDFAGNPPKTGSSSGQVSNVASANTTSTNNGSNTQKPIGKVGTIYNAILETGINSDEPSPVLAKIVSGPLKGAKLVGSISTVGEKVVVVFNNASIPDVSTSVKLNAYAVDPNSSRTALADNVDRHYFLRYGVLLATSFVGAYSQALATSGSTTTTSLSGTTTTNPTYNSTQLRNIALGGVGQKLAQDTQQQYGNLKPTITVNPGAPIGILLMDDLYIKDNSTANNNSTTTQNTNNNQIKNTVLPK